MAVVYKIEQKPQLPPKPEEPSYKKRKVAIYARVSTDHEEQKTSLQAQMDYYRKMIAEHEDWTYVATYADNGISGTSIKRRGQFLKMMEACEAGEIDLILTKSISRFARNTVDSVKTLRKLKALNIEVFFQKENIWTSRSEGEFLITLMSSLAQEESRSISENTAWGKRKSFAQGKYSVAYSRFLGYDKDMELNPEEADVVRRIYRLFLEGFSTNAICNILEEMELAAPAGGKVWSPSVVRSILTNEKYKGDALLQKCFTEDFLSKKQKKNTGELDQYYVTGGHEAIIDPALFDYVQKALEEKDILSKQRHRSFLHYYSGKIICGTCGAIYIPRMWHPERYNEPVWSCARRDDKAVHCRNPHLYEKGLDDLVNLAMQLILNDRSSVLDILKKIVPKHIRSSSKKEDAVRYITEFTKMPMADLPADTEDLDIILERITVWPDMTLTVRLIYDTEMKVTAPRYSPTYGWRAMPKKVKSAAKAAEPMKKQVKNSPKKKQTPVTPKTDDPKWENLSRGEKISALRSRGCSYGQISKSLGVNINTVKSHCRRERIAEELPEEQKPRRKQRKEIKAEWLPFCKYCGKPLQPVEGKRKKVYCDSKCRSRWWTAHKELAPPRKPKGTLKCECCGKDFMVYDNRKRKYCSPECYQQARWEA